MYVRYEAIIEANRRAYQDLFGETMKIKVEVINREFIASAPGADKTYDRPPNGYGRSRDEAIGNLFIRMSRERVPGWPLIDLEQVF